MSLGFGSIGQIVTWGLKRLVMNIFHYLRDVKHQSKNMHVRLISVSKVVLRSECEHVCGCLSRLSLCGPVMALSSVYPVSRLMTAGIGSSPPATRPTD